MELENIIGFEDEQKKMERVIDTLFHPEKYDNPNLMKPRGLLITGEFTEYKNRVFKWFLNASHQDTCYQIDSENIDDKNLVYLFSNAKKSGGYAVIREIKQHPVTEEAFTKIKGYLLNKGYSDVFVIFIVNNEDQWKKFLRELNPYFSKVELNFPNIKDLTKIVEYYFDKYNVKTKIKPKEMASLLEDGKKINLEETLNEALLISLNQGHDCILDNDFKEALIKNYRNICPIKDKEADEDYLRNAIHESGHIIMQEYLCPGSFIFAYIKQKDKSKCGGQGIFIDDYQNLDTEESKEKEIMAYLGGKAAVEIVYGGTDLGAPNDLMLAFNYTRKIMAYCFIDTHLDYVKPNTPFDDSELENKVKAKVQDLLDRTKNYLSNNRELLDMMSKFVYENEIIYQEDISRIINEYNGTKQ